MRVPRVMFRVLDSFQIVLQIGPNTLRFEIDIELQIINNSGAAFLLKINT